MERNAGLLAQELEESKTAGAERDTAYKPSECGPVSRLGSHAMKLAMTPRNFGRADIFLPEIRAQPCDSVVMVSEPKRTRTRAAPDSLPLTTASASLLPGRAARAAGEGETEDSLRRWWCQLWRCGKAGEPVKAPGPRPNGLAPVSLSQDDSNVHSRLSL